VNAIPNEYPSDEAIRAAITCAFIYNSETRSRVKGFASLGNAYFSAFPNRMREPDDKPLTSVPREKYACAHELSALAQRGDKGVQDG
jgi:hypothetical protein